MKDKNDLPALPHKVTEAQGRAGPLPDNPLQQAARCLEKTLRPFNPAIPSDMHEADLLHDLHTAMADDDACATMLQTQAHVLDGVFVRLVAAAVEPRYSKNGGTPNMRGVDNDFMQLALRAQKQCRQTAQALATMHAFKTMTNELRDPKK